MQLPENLVKQRDQVYEKNVQIQSDLIDIRYIAKLNRLIVQRLLVKDAVEARQRSEPSF